MPRVRIRLDGTAVDGWLAAISSEFPDVEFRILATQVRDERSHVILEARTSRGDAVAHRFESTPEVNSFEVLHADERTALVRFATSSSRAYDPLFRSKNVSLYPTVLRDGRFTVTLVASRERLSKYTDELAAAGIPYEVLSVTRSREKGELLTDRQWEFVTAAIERGYYDAPRRCTLADLAESLGIQKPAASKLCRRAESRIIKEYASERRDSRR